MYRRSARRQLSIGILVVGHAAIAALLGVAACSLVLSGLTGDTGYLGSIRDPGAALALSLTIASLLAAGSGISAFILLSVERAAVSRGGKPTAI